MIENTAEKLRPPQESTHQTSKVQPCNDAATADRENRFSNAVTKKIVIYGGQDPWRAAIGKIIPGLKFAHQSKHVDTELIRHADVVWVQTHAISHSTYTTVRACARRCGVPVRIFMTKGVSSCVAQLASCAVS